MKKYSLFLVLILLSSTAMAKKVKFSVDMSAQTISPNGVHVTGDFQTVAGYSGGDWASNTTEMLQEDSSMIYSVIVDIPAFAKYEYKFINGDQFYEAEFVPVESRVGYDFNDNRWLYVDSLTNDTTFVGAIRFAENSPTGKLLVRFYVDMQNETVSADGVHLAGNYQGWDAASNILYNFQNAVYEVIGYVETGDVSYVFYNGEDLSEAEDLPDSCTDSGNRQLSVTDYIVLDVVCFNSCSACIGTAGLSDNTIASVTLAPNPSPGSTVLTLAGGDSFSAVVYDASGKQVLEYRNQTGNILEIQRNNLQRGIYFVSVVHGSTVEAPVKWFVE
jgi:hypothetical protein